jgi:hypothetical protein
MTVYCVTSQRAGKVRARDTHGYYASEDTANALAATLNDGKVTAVSVFEGTFEDYKSQVETQALEAARLWITGLDPETRRRLGSELAESPVAPA